MNNISNPLIFFCVVYYHQIAAVVGKPVMLPIPTLSNGPSPVHNVNESEALHTR
jgi:hypothetical protein